MKLGLVTIDANLRTPWDMTAQASACVAKSSHISAVCRIELEEDKVNVWAPIDIDAYVRVPGNGAKSLTPDIA